MKRTFLIILASWLVVLVFAGSGGAGFSDVLGKIKSQISTEPSGTSVGAEAELSDLDVLEGLKEALSKGVATSITSLGRTDGYFGNEAVRILLPEGLQKLDAPLRLAGQGELLDDLVLTMNRAAEEAVPQAASILGDAVKNMSVSDARGVLAGPDDAATQYFRRSSGDRISEMMQPLISKATDSVGVTRAYKTLTANPLAAGLARSSGLDLDAYVNAKAQDGLFLLIAEEERNIRANPVARTTDILKRVFGGE